MFEYKDDVYVAPSSAKVLGAVVAALRDNLDPGWIDPVLAQHGYRPADIQPDKYYPLQILYDVCTQVVRHEGRMAGLTRLGKALAPALLNTRRFSSPDEFFEAASNNDVLKTHIRDMPYEFDYAIEQLGEKHYRVINTTTTPNEFIQGYLWEAMRILVPGGEFRVIPIGDTALMGDTGATYLISWA